MKKYKAVDGNNKVKTYHAHNITSKAVITEFEDHIDVLVIELHKMYSIHLNKNNQYEIKDLNEESSYTKFTCKDIRNQNNDKNCNCEISYYPSSDSTQYNFSYGSKITKYKNINKINK